MHTKRKEAADLGSKRAELPSEPLPPKWKRILMPASVAVFALSALLLAFAGLGDGRTILTLGTFAGVIAGALGYRMAQPSKEFLAKVEEIQRQREKAAKERSRVSAELKGLKRSLRKVRKELRTHNEILDEKKLRENAIFIWLMGEFEGDLSVELPSKTRFLDFKDVVEALEKRISDFDTFITLIFERTRFVWDIIPGSAKDFPGNS